MNSSDHDQALRLEQVLSILRRRAPVIMLCLVLVAGFSFAFSKHQTKEYTATASLVFDNAQISQQVAGLQVVTSNEPKAQQSTNVKLLQLGPTAEHTASKIGEPLTTSQVKQSLSISAEGESNVVNVSATSTSPTRAALIANTYAKQFVADQIAANHRYFSSARALVDKQLAALSPQERVAPQGLALQDRAQSLTILAQLQAGNVQLAQAATVPTSPSSPKVARNTVLGALLGLLLGIGLAFLLERLNRRLRDPEEAREAFGLPVLGTVPESKAIMASNEGAAAAELPFMENEAFRMLRASLRYFNVDRDIRTVLITSHAAGVGKSTVAWNLARVAASSSRAVIVETDLRNPTLSRQHGLSAGPGLAELLTHQVELEEVIQAKPIVAGGNGAGGGERALDVIVAGALPPNPAELIESQRMSEALAQLAERYELVVIDTAPVGVVSDAIPLMRKVDGVIVVVRMDKSTRDGAEQTREQMERLEAPVLGVVANAIKARRGGKYGYGYYGGYYQQAAKQQAGADIGTEPSV